MTCVSCGASTTADAKFCPNCGKPLAGACPKCGTATTPKEKFCRNCGTSLTDAATASSRPDTEATQSGTYTVDVPQYYKEKFRRFDANGERFLATWNWPAFFFSWIWYLTKGMAAKGALMLGASLFVAIIGAITFPILWISISPAINIYAGLYGNFDYYLLKKRNTQWWWD
jgi:RNA polymerase subunit RPABC4/transcription elongation factor Spt4